MHVVLPFSYRSPRGCLLSQKSPFFPLWPASNIDLRKNLISIGKLTSEGCISIFTDNMWRVNKGSLVIEKGEKVGTLYLCTGNTISSISLASPRVDTTLWHHRIGHMSEKGM
jgi:hypothetical protein